jgi:hypothetical protein
MTLINPGSLARSFEILGDLTTNVGKRLGIVVKPYNTEVIRDASEAVHWMYRYDDLETRVYRIQRSFQRFIDIHVGDDGLVDPDEIEIQIHKAFLELNQRVI